MSEQAQTEAHPRNFQAILDWCEAYRPDLRPVILAEKDNNGFILLMTVGFEAGRHFQKDNPDYPMDQAHVYLADNDPLRQSQSQAEPTESGPLSMLAVRVAEKVMNMQTGEEIRGRLNAMLFQSPKGPASLKEIIVLAVDSEVVHLTQTLEMVRDALERSKQAHPQSLNVVMARINATLNDVLKI